MSRVLLAWELGSNLGHLSRLLPLARALRARGHEVLVAVRDVGLATEVLAPTGIPFIQSPRGSGNLHSDARPTSFADVMLMQGWENPTVLWGLVQAWGNLLKLFRPSLAVLDYSPTMLLAARILALPSVLLGTGFELPPIDTPLPVLPGFPGSPLEAATAADTRALRAANSVLDAYGAPRLAALRDVFRTELRRLTTFAELDQYGPRPGETYVGPIGGLDRGESIEWPEGFTHRVLAYLRPGTPALSEILRALAGETEAAVICAVPGVSADSVKGLARPGFALFAKPVNLRPLFPRASAFASYAPAASVAESLLCGIPQLMAPAHVEAQMTAIRVQSIGAGLALGTGANDEAVRTAIHRMLHDGRYKVRALEFANRYRGFDPAAAVDTLVGEIEQLAARTTSNSSASRRAG